MKKMILIPLTIGAILISGCSSPSQTNPPAAASEGSTPPQTISTALEGSWKGHDVTPGHEGSVSLAVSGQTLEFHGTGADDWIKGSFTLREDTDPKQLVGIVTECAAPENVGQKVCAIYKIEDGTLTISGNQLGDPNFPTAFDAAGCRQLVLKHSQ